MQRVSVPAQTTTPPQGWTLVSSMASALVVAAAFLPYFRILPIDTDVQPYPLALAIVLAPFGFISLRQAFSLDVLLCLFFGIVSLVVSGLSSSLAAFLYFALSLFFYRALSPWLIGGVDMGTKVAILAYSLGAVLDVAGLNLGMIVTNSRGGEERGLSSFASEPSFYGWAGVMIFATRYLVLKKFDAYLVIVLFNVLASGSMAAIGPLMIFVAIVLLCRNGVRAQIVSLIYISLIVSIVSLFLYRIDRVRIFVDAIVADPSIETVVKDKSALDRVARGIFPIYSAVQEPLRLNLFNADIRPLENEADEFFYPREPDFNGRVGSSFGVLAYELGIFGLGIIALFLWKAYRHGLAHLALMLLVGISLVTISSPPLAIYIALLGLPPKRLGKPKAIP